MEENKTADFENNEEPRGKGKLAAKLDNFWYHYKWHSIVALLLVFAITVFSLQMCKQEDYDIYIMYAGPKQISRVMENGNFCEYDTTMSSFKQVVSDFDENGGVSISFLDLYMLSQDEIKELEKGDGVNYTLLNNNNQTFRDTMLYSGYYICFLSERLYLEYAKTEGVFAPIEPYTNGLDVDFLDTGAIYLHSEALKFNTLPGICDLPCDTVICLRSKSVISAYLSQKENEKQYARSLEVLEAIFKYGN